MFSAPWVNIDGNAPGYLKMTEGEFSSSCNRDFSYLLRLGSGNLNLAINIGLQPIALSTLAYVQRACDREILPLAQDGDRF